VSGGCGTPVATDVVTVNVLTLPSVNFSVDNTQGCTPVTVNFSHTPEPGSNCNWDFGDGTTSTNCNPQHIFTQPGCYTITLNTTNSSGCPNDTSVSNMICVFAMPEADFSFLPQPASVFDPEVTFTNLTVGGSGYAWDFDGLGYSIQTNPSFTFPADSGGAYLVCLSTVSNEGCMDSTCHMVIIESEFLMYVPNTFTPDGDGHNDIFFPVFQGEDPTTYELFIFNRWGELIFQSNNKLIGWDGTHNGIKSKEDVYVWKIKVRKELNQDKKEFIGHVNLLR
jgi:gliding motility-associated-like protein